MSTTVQGLGLEDEAGLWRRFAATPEAEAIPLWFDLLCRQMPGVSAGLLLTVSKEAHTFLPAAIWPPQPGVDVAYLGDVAREALTERRGIIRRVDAEGQPLEGGASREGKLRAFLAYPVECDTNLIAVIVVDVQAASETDLIGNLRTLHWGSAWLRARILQADVTALRQSGAVYAEVLHALVTVQQPETLQASLFALVNVLADRFACERVALGLVKGQAVVVTALSRSAWFDPQAELVRLLAAAMDETRRAHKPLLLPADDAALVMPAHAALEHEERGCLLSLPLQHGDREIAVLLLQRAADRPFAEPEHYWLETFAALAGPGIAAQTKADRSLLRHGWETLQAGWKKLAGPRHYTWKLVTAVAVLFVMLTTAVPMTYRVSAKTAIEGEVQRVIPAPFQGFVSRSYHRAGETVHAGDVLAELDNKDLLTEEAKWQGESEQYARKLREAMAERDLSGTQVLAAQYDQAKAQLDMVQDKLARLKLTAPFDGIVVSGDLSQSIGEPVEEGKTLFEVAPLTRYKVVLKVDERDVAWLHEGQRGELVLSGMPGERMSLVVKRIVPVAVAEDGGNTFRVEADLQGKPPRLRPGMEGIGKVEVGHGSLLWIWTHRFTDWLRLQLWTWL
jgi:RND family efflux transporter MFP subunit